jgi:hypothetical protein
MLTCRFLTTRSFQLGGTEHRIRAPPRIGSQSQPRRQLLRREPHRRDPCRVSAAAARLLEPGPGTGPRPDARARLHLPVDPA